MDNLKITKALCSVIMAGVTIGLVYSHYEGYDSFLYKEKPRTVIDKHLFVDKVDGLSQYLDANNLVPISSDMLFDDSILVGRFAEVKKCLPYIDDGKLKFKEEWSLISYEDLKSFTGLVRESDSASRIIYEVIKTENGFEKVEVNDSNFDVSKTYYYDKDDYLILNSPDECYYFNGSRVRK